jgi:hypothetical protein
MALAWINRHRNFVTVGVLLAPPRAAPHAGARVRQPLLLAGHFVAILPQLVIAGVFAGRWPGTMLPEATRSITIAPCGPVDIQS